MKPFPVVVIAPAVLAWAVSAAAESTLDDVVVTASRSLSPLNLKLDAATVITRADIERQQAASLADLLSQTVGLSIAPQGSALTASGVFLRGFAAKQVLVLIDGVRANDANQGQFDFSQLRADDIERIEVIRGGNSSQYGSDALGGVIAITTRRDRENSLTTRLGSFGTLENTLALGHTHADGQVGLSLSQLDVNGFDATRNKAIQFGSANSPDRDGGRQRTLRLFGQHTLNPAHQLSGSLLLKEQRSEFDNGESEGNLTLANLTHDWRVTDRYQQRVELTLNRTLLDTPAFNSQFDTQRWGVTWLHTVDLNTAGTLTAGLSHVEENTQLSGSNTFERDLTNQAVFLIHEARRGAFSSRLSGRFEDHEQWGQQTTGGWRLGYAAHEQVNMYVGYSENFRAPTSNDLFGPFGGNPNLKPEETEQVDVGLNWRYHAQHQLSLNAFHTRAHELIAFSAGQSRNIQEATLKGVELELKGRHEHWNYQLGLVRARNTDDLTDNDLVRRPGTQLNADVSYQVTPTIQAGIQQLSRNRMNDVGGPNAGFTVINTYATWRTLSNLDVGVRLDNAANRDYSLVNGFRTAGRSGYVTATYRF